MQLERCLGQAPLLTGVRGSRRRQRLQTLLTDQAATMQMFERAKQGVRIWMDAHDDLRKAVRENRRPNVRLLLSTALEIKEVVDRVRSRNN